MTLIKHSILRNIYYIHELNELSELITAITEPQERGTKCFYVILMNHLLKHRIYIFYFLGYQTASRTLYQAS